MALGLDGPAARTGAASGAAEWAPAQAAVRAGHEAERIARRVVDRLTLDEAAALRQEIAEALQRGVAEAQRGFHSRLGALLRQLETQAAGHPALAKDANTVSELSRRPCARGR